MQDGAGGLRFRADDDADLARVLRRFLDDPGLARRLGDRAPVVKTADEWAGEMEIRYMQAISASAGGRGRDTGVPPAADPSCLG